MVKYPPFPASAITLTQRVRLVDEVFHKLAEVWVISDLQETVKTALIEYEFHFVERVW